MGINHLAREVQRNCDISDARHAGVFSICGLALRLRDLYRWERGLDPWEEGDPGALLEWIGVRETLWDTLAAAEYGNLLLVEREFDPFRARLFSSWGRPAVEPCCTHRSSKPLLKDLSSFPHSAAPCLMTLVLTTCRR